jgi:hypothetical protein
MEERPRIPRPIEARVLYNNDHTCCICRLRDKDVHIHHIDGNARHNVPENLAVLCLDCHSRVTGGRGLGKRYSSLEVRKYKSNWELIVRKRREEIREVHLPPSKAERSALRIEAKKNMFYLSSTANMTQAREILRFLETYAFFEGDTFWILDQLYGFVPFIWGGDQKRALLAAYIPQFHSYLPGPDFVKLKKIDKEELRKSIDLLEWIGEFGTFGDGFETIWVSLRSLTKLAEIIEPYDLSGHRHRIISAMKTIRKSVKESVYLTRDEKGTLSEKADRYLGLVMRES